MVNADETDICDKDPGKEVDVYFTTTVRTMADIWMGETTYRSAMGCEALSIIGPSVLVNTVSDWMHNSIFTELPSAREI